MSKIKTIGSTAIFTYVAVVSIIGLAQFGKEVVFYVKDKITKK